MTNPPTADDGPVEIDPDLADLLPGFFRNRVRDLARARSLLSEGAVRDVQRIGHGIAGSGLSYGFPVLSRLGRALEDAAIEGDSARCTAVLEVLATTLERIQVSVGGRVMRFADWAEEVG